MEEDSTRKLEILKEKNNQIKILGIRSTSNNNNNKKHGERHQQTWSAEEKKTILKVRAKKILHPNTNKENNENDQCPRPQEYEQEIKPKKLNA